MFPKTYFNLMMQGKRGLSLELTFLTIPIFQAISPVHSWPLIPKWCCVEAWHWCLLGISDFVVENWETNDFCLYWGIEIPVCGCAVMMGFLVLWHGADRPANLATFCSSLVFIIHFPGGLQPTKSTHSVVEVLRERVGREANLAKWLNAEKKRIVCGTLHAGTWVCVWR